jgi:hypothetical protein
VLSDLAACYLLGLGVCMNNAIAVLRGLFLPIRTFVRTPKQGTRPALRTPAPRLEQVMMAATLGSVAWVAHTQPWAAAAYALFFAAGFVFFIAHWWVVERRA